MKLPVIFFFFETAGWVPLSTPLSSSFIQTEISIKNQVHDPDKYGASGLCASPRSPVTRGTTTSRRMRVNTDCRRETN